MEDLRGMVKAKVTPRSLYRFAYLKQRELLTKYFNGFISLAALSNDTDLLYELVLRRDAELDTLYKSGGRRAAGEDARRPS